MTLILLVLGILGTAMVLSETLNNKVLAFVKLEQLVASPRTSDTTVAIAVVSTAFLATALGSFLTLVIVSIVAATKLVPSLVLGLLRRCAKSYSSTHSSNHFLDVARCRYLMVFGSSSHTMTNQNYRLTTACSESKWARMRETIDD